MEKILLSKELFIESLEKIQKQFKHDEKCCKALEIVYPNDHIIGGYDNSLVLNQLNRILKVLMNDDHIDSIIDYFIYDLNFGQTYTEGCFVDENQTNVNISTFEKLYEYLTK